MIHYLIFCASLLLATFLTGCQSAPPVPEPAATLELADSQTVVEPPAQSPSDSATPSGAARSASLDYENNVYFDFGKAVLTEQGIETLTAHAKRLKENTKLAVTLVGYTDNLGSPAYNQAISDARLSVVMSTLQAKGVARKQMRRISMGNERKNSARCRSEDCRRAMRRVELVYAIGARR